MIALTEIVIPSDLVYGSKYPPLALACLARVLKDAGHAHELVMFQPDDDPEAWLRAVLASKPSVVAFSVFMGYKLERALELTRLVKKARPDLSVLWGGVHPSLMPEETLRDPHIDWICVGAGEPMILALAEALDRGDSLDTVPSLARMIDGRYVLQGPGIPRQKDITLSRPDWDSFPVEQFLFGEDPGERIVGIMSSQGCPHQCGFCYNSRFHGQRWQPSPQEAVQAEMRYLRERFGANGFLFLDDLFFANRKRAVGLLRWMGENDFCCNSLDLRLSEVDAEVIDALRLAKTKSVFIGVESTDDRILKLIKKQSTRADLMAAMEHLNAAPDIRLWLSCIVGFPEESFQEMQQTIADMAGLAKRPNTMVNLNAFIPMPGTGLYDLAVEHGFEEPCDAVAWTQLARSRGSDLDHFPGRFSKGETQYLQRAAHYLSMLYRPYPQPQAGPKAMARGLFASLAAWRLNHRMVFFPLDLWLYQKLRSSAQRLRKQVD